MTYQMCTRCVMDTSDPEIRFDAEGVCSHCHEARGRLASRPSNSAERSQRLERLVARIREEGRGKVYDSIIGVSGGVDSSAVAYHAKQHGLRPLAVHFDNGWNSELAVDNIASLLGRLEIDLHTHVVDWEEFRDLQLCFLKASIPNCEAPTDHAITALLFQTARQHGLRYILSGSNVNSESIMPIAWGYYNQDLRLLKALHARFGQKPLKTTPTISLSQYLNYVFVYKIRQIPFLNYIEYDKGIAKSMLMEAFGWRDYGGKHYESVWTRFFQGYYLPEKFGYDKRKAHLSSLIACGQMTRAEALLELEKPAYDPTLLRQDRAFVIKKFGLTEAAFENLLRAPGVETTTYPNHHFLFHKLRRFKNLFRQIATTP